MEPWLYIMDAPSAANPIKHLLKYASMKPFACKQFIKANSISSAVVPGNCISSIQKKKVMGPTFSSSVALTYMIEHEL